VRLDRRVAATGVIALLAACTSEGPATEPPRSAAAADVADLRSGDWEIAFRRSYPPTNPPSTRPPVTPADGRVAMSAAVVDGGVTAFYSVTRDAAGRVWVDSVVPPGAAQVTKRYWLDCRVERLPFPRMSLGRLVEDVVGPLGVPPDAVRTAGGVRTWSRPEGVLDVRVTQSGSSWVTRRLSFHRPPSGAHLYTVDDIEFGTARTSPGRQAESADRAFRKQCRR
jgi:hypothetical protein